MTRMRKNRDALVLCVVAMLISGCGGKQEPAPTEAPSGSSSSPSVPSSPTGTSSAPTQSPDMAQMVAQTQKAVQQANQGKVVEPLSPSAMKELLPPELPGLTRTEATTQRSQTGGIDMSVTDGQYEAEDGGASIHIKIMDVGNLSGPMRRGLVGWAMTQYNRETDTGYEKTTTYAGYKAMEKYDTQSKQGTLRVFVADRWVVEVEGSQTTMEAIKQAMDAIGVKKLAALK
jgi:hypothetical protein